MPITWKNISAADFSNGNALMKSGADTFTGGLDSLAKAAQTYGDQQEDQRVDVRNTNTQNLVDQINQMKSMDNYNSQADQFSQRALMGQNVDASKVLSAYNQQEQDIQGLMTSRNDFNASQHAESKRLLGIKEKPAIDAFKALMASGDNEGARKLLDENLDGLTDTAPLYQALEDEVNSDADRAFKVAKDDRTRAGWDKTDVTDRIVGQIGGYTDLDALKEYAGGADYQSALLKGNGATIAAAVKKQLGHIITTANSEIELSSTIENQYQRGLYKGFATKVGDIFGGQMDGDYNDIMRSITDLKQNGEYNAMTPDTRAQVDDYVTALTAKLTNTPAPVQKKIERQIQGIPTTEYKVNDKGVSVSFRDEEAGIATDTAMNDTLLAKIPEVYKPGHTPMMEGELPSAIRDSLNISGDVWWSGEENQEDIATSIGNVKTYAKKHYGESIPLEVIFQAFKVAHVVDVDPETGKAEFDEDMVNAALETAVAEWKLAKKNVAAHRTASTALNVRSLKYSDALTAAQNKITDDEQRNYLNANKLKGTK